MKQPLMFTKLASLTFYTVHFIQIQYSIMQVWPSWHLTSPTKNLTHVCATPKIPG